MPTFSLPEPFVGGAPGGSTPELDAIQSNFENLTSFLNEFAGRFFWGTGSPENAVTAPVGCIYFRLDGGAATTLYIKESGTGNTGWIGK